MSFAIPDFSRKAITRAGKVLIDRDADIRQYAEALRLVNHWRACHAYPVNTFQATLRFRLRKVCPDALVAQRLKRVPSIVRKLEINDGMQLARMQDIGGLRAVVNSQRQVQQLHDLYVNGGLTHELVDIDDYIAAPKSSGYRSLHIVYRYKNPVAPAYDGLMLELQVRTRLQHTWATAVETIGSFLNQALKANEGSTEWLEFFQTVSAAFAHMERAEVAEKFRGVAAKDIWGKCLAQAHKLDVHRKLTAFAVAANAINSDSAPGSYHLVVLDAAERTVSIESFGRRRLEDANEAYTRAEQRALSHQDMQVVLVATGSIDSLKRAYPNYFLDTRQFLSALRRIAKLAGMAVE